MSGRKTNKTTKGMGKKPYSKPDFKWEEKLEPVVFGVTCARKALQNPQCQAAPLT